MTDPPLNTITWPKIMVGVATAQNTVNTVPAIQLKVNEFYFVQTIGKAQEKWVKNGSSALNFKGIETHNPIILQKNIDDNLEQITKTVKDSIPQSPIIFNLGGGLKIHSLALWELFIHRNSSKDLACYSNPQKGVIDFWRWEKKSLSQFTIPLEFEDDLENFLRVFGFSVQEKGLKVFENEEILYEENYFDFFQFTEFREFLSKSFSDNDPLGKDEINIEKIKALINLKDKQQREFLFDEIKRKNPVSFNDDEKKISVSHKQFKINIIDQILKHVRERLILVEKLKSPKNFEFSNSEIIVELEKRGLPTTYVLNSNSVRKILGENSGFYFEKILLSEIAKILKSENHIVSKAYANVKIKSEDAAAEFDIILLTKLGTFYVLDGKLDEFDKKDENSRKLNVIKSGGVFSSFIPVFSFYPEDLDSEWVKKSIPQKIKEYHLQGVKFMIHNKLDNRPKNITVLNEEVELPHFSDLLDYLNLK